MAVFMKIQFIINLHAFYLNREQHSLLGRFDQINQLIMEMQKLHH